jgi:hypothetical protein
MALPDLRGLLAALVGDEVEFVVIGGLAVAVHGFIRATEDIDIVPAPDHDNLDRLVNRLVQLDGRLTLSPERVPGAAERRALRQGRNLSVTTALGDVDVVQRLPGVPGFAELAGRAKRVDAFGLMLSVASLGDLIAMKRARASATDLADLEYLESAAEERYDPPPPPGRIAPDS